MNLRLATFRSRLFPALLVLAVAAGLAGTATARAAAPALTLVPREGTGLGTLSAYGGVASVFSADAAGVDGIDIPDTGKTEVNLIWTFWSHKQPGEASWPVGPRARSTFTLRSATEATLALRMALRVAGEWTEMIPAPDLSLAAGKPATVSLPLPASVPVGKIEVVRVQITSRVPVPALRVTDWTIAEQQ